MQANSKLKRYLDSSGSKLMFKDYTTAGNMANVMRLVLDKMKDMVDDDDEVVARTLTNTEGHLIPLDGGILFTTANTSTYVKYDHVG